MEPVAKPDRHRDNRAVAKERNRHQDDRGTSPTSSINHIQHERKRSPSLSSLGSEASSSVAKRPRLATSKPSVQAQRDADAGSISETDAWEEPEEHTPALSPLPVGADPVGDVSDDSEDSDEDEANLTPLTSGVLDAPAPPLPVVDAAQPPRNGRLAAERAGNGLELSELLRMQAKLSKLVDRKVLQKVVTVIEATGKFSISDVSFDFDLCTLDKATVGKLREYLDPIPI